jgi:glycosyltransferase involved in cell wall biosynthesis
MIPESVLFITRNYPPKIGGLEEYSYNLIKEFESHGSTWKITLSKPIKHLLWFYPYSLFKALYVIRKYTVQHVHLCDGLLAPVGILLKILTGVTVTATIHGLDITYRHPVYQKLIPRCIEKLDRIVCVSRSTRDECLNRIKIPPRNCIVIPNGIRPERLCIQQSERELRLELEKLTGVSLSNRKILVTIGHLIKRKGVAWFIAKVMPKLREGYLYLVAGDGPEKSAIKQAVERHCLENSVVILGEVTNRVRNIICNVSDIFIMPNITIPNDVEGFGIVAIEAGSRGLPVVASDIQGIRDAVIDGKTGFLVREGHVDGFLEKIRGMDLNKDQIKKTVTFKYDWGKLFKDYRDFLFF